MFFFFRVSLWLCHLLMATMVRLWRAAAASSLSSAHASAGWVLSSGAPLLSLGPTHVDVLPISCILHQRDVVVGGQREVRDAAHQPSQVLPVGVQGDLLHSTWGKGNDEKLFTNMCSCSAHCMPGSVTQLPSKPQR